MYRLLVAQVLLGCWIVAQPFCPSQCTCVYHGRSDGTGSRSVLCNDPDMSDIPVNVPVDTVKLRVEKTAVRRVPTEAFYYLPELCYLWITYNSVTSVDPGSFYNLKVLHELRLDGNMIATFPWESLKEMPSLRTLDLHNNRLTSIPVEAALYLVNITYLDISSNKLTTLPSDLVDIWPPFSGILPSANASQKTVLGLQDNPWYCDCRIAKLIELSKMASIPVVLMDQVLTCSGPENLAGVLFQRAELDQCSKPSVMTSATKITSPLGSNVLLRCDATGFPTPTLLWTRADGTTVNVTVVQESPGEGVRWSILSLHSIVIKDAGDYRCKAKNFAGNAEAYITLSVDGVQASTPSPPINITKQPDDQPVTSFAGTKMPLYTTLSPALTTRAAMTTIPPLTTRKSPGPGGGIQRSPPAGDKPAKIQQSKGGKGSLTSEKSKKKADLKDIEVVEETSDTAVLLWRAEGLPSDSPLTVFYFPYDAKDDKETVDTEVGQGKLLLEYLMPNQVYTVCLVTKGSVAGKEQCVDFTTLDNGGEDGQNKILMIASGIACAVAVPLIVVLLYKIVCLCCKGNSSRNNGPDDDLSKETYVKFETLTMKQRTLNGQANDLWARRQTQESERMLLCSRSSIDSQMTYKSDSSRSEYLC
ncbi:leucine-rich repeat, immunoglobulin-like domain and transmembrane domain-containing protein 3 [Sinocyclocheilus rhinocerous]|uniref:Leucine-rich repeat, immunoglobulin-like domain and transmembrane domain-containing protein 3 n=1 Tax=Sinocyclocheilus rhinocerous TaxID=307959 RepID=A0A673GAI7_9TELE|nr:PREDICTED: leucine-rich repeat, immunoglobulin-like domain and transmembrane domain-containing protein 3 [Sinocyclocheilus rhinocerous]